MTSNRELRERWKWPPGGHVRHRINQFLLSLAPGHGRNSEEVFEMLEGLPFREEVLNGRDFRGATLVGFREMDLSNCDFGQASVISFYNCDLTGSRFDGGEGEGVTIHKTANRASFRNIKVRNLCMDGAEARESCFEGARIPYASFLGADLRGTSFRNADCKRTTFVQCNLVGCDFQGALLDEAIFQDVQLDKSTDLRGASLINLFNGDRRDAYGNLLWHGTDWRLGTYDTTTRHHV